MTQNMNSSAPRPAGRCAPSSQASSTAAGSEIDSLAAQDLHAVPDARPACRDRSRRRASLRGSNSAARRSSRRRSCSPGSPAPDRRRISATIRSSTRKTARCGSSGKSRGRRNGTASAVIAAAFISARVAPRRARSRARSGRQAQRAVGRHIDQDRLAADPHLAFRALALIEHGLDDPVDRAAGRAFAAHRRGGPLRAGPRSRPRALARDRRLQALQSITASLADANSTATPPSRHAAHAAGQASPICRENRARMPSAGRS